MTEKMNQVQSLDDNHKYIKQIIKPLIDEEVIELKNKEAIPLEYLFDKAPISCLGLLPTEAILASIQYCIESDDMPNTLEMHDVFKDVPATLLEIPVDVIKEAFMSIPDIQRHGDFEKYHRWYMDGGDVPVYSAENRWPCIASVMEDEVVDDGNHRLHAYIEAGHETIPVLKYDTNAWWKAHENWKQSVKSQSISKVKCKI